MIYPKKSRTAKDVSRHYDNLDEVYRKVWGEHLHHGLWKKRDDSVEDAVLNLVDLIAEKLTLFPGAAVCDIGCGYGATDCYLAHRFQAKVTGLTISEKQWNHATRAKDEDSNTIYLLRDFLRNGLPSNHFDRAFAIESSEHMEDKILFFSEVFRIIKPGGTFALCCWLAKEAPHNWESSLFLKPICDEGRLPSLASESEIVAMMQNAGLQVSEMLDLTKQVEKTWNVCIYKTLKAVLSSLGKYLISRDSTEKCFFKTLFRIKAAYRVGCLRYGLFIGKK